MRYPIEWFDSTSLFGAVTQIGGLGEPSNPDEMFPPLAIIHTFVARHSRKEGELKITLNRTTLCQLSKHTF